ncbi:polygalacturonase At1g48100-like [Amaranthus tricolor]|uniref:polygalacturonase At1g48100-like n=1 Tax=Amaranthus tricolor TaxID=29722 RepID=UPI002583D811|nr:polygalacturonase At1g48100-like [Amaranthus tricolor]
MRSLEVKIPTLMLQSLLITLLLWSTNFDMCNARRGSHWRQSRPLSASLLKKKGKSHGYHGHNHHHSSNPKPKPKPASPTIPTPSPEVGTPPLPPPIQKAPYLKGSPPKAMSPPNPTPIVKIPSPQPQKGSSVFSVLDYGAKGDGSSDDTEAFEATWTEACKVQSSTMLIPSGYQFLVGPITFSGPYCQKNIIFQLDGTIIAPTSPTAWKSNLLWWMDFTKLVGITIQGRGVIDGSGSAWWTDAPYDLEDHHELQIIINDTILEKPPMPLRSELSGKMPNVKPTALRFYGSINVTVTGITIQNSPQCHLKFDNCIGVMVYSVSVSSPGDSPNTDGIHLQNSKDVLIHSSSLACGDDCISIQTGCSNVYIHSVNCGPGHGISIGSLGRYDSKACVSNITVRDVNIQGTMTGVRIKTWQGGSGSVQGITFSNIQVSEVQLPIVIDQYYCDKSTCKNASAAVAVSGVTYQNIKGTYTVKPVHLACSDELPCTDITLNTIQLTPLQEQHHLYDPYCWQSFGELMAPIAPPLGCLQIGKPMKSKVQTDVDIC